jgi:hypothetical protein
MYTFYTTLLLEAIRAFAYAYVNKGCKQMINVADCVVEWTDMFHARVIKFKIDFLNFQKNTLFILDLSDINFSCTIHSCKSL